MPFETEGRRFSERLYESSNAIWEQSHQHPFLTGLREGTLEAERFIYYMKQDYVYLIDYAKMFAIGSIKARDLETISKLAELFHSTLNVEMELHRQYADRLGISRGELEATEPAPTTIAYTKFMLEAAAQGSLAEVIAALLPCMWSYREVGCAFAQVPGTLDHPLYGEWVKMYSSAEFGSLTDWTIGLMDSLAAGLPERDLGRLEHIFITASKFEYMFWDMAYRQEEWPV
ncbi:thiaminase II [Paenibacillaceae bacterium]|nr:thiaminase II [Paenibacillaceae bacterium]